MKKIILAIALLTPALSISQAPRAPGSVLALGKLCHWLESVYGCKIHVDASVAETPLFIWGTLASCPDTLRDLAAACHCTLVNFPQGFLLTRSPEDSMSCKNLHSRIAEGWLERRFDMWDAQARQESQIGGNLAQLEDVVHQNSLDQQRRALGVDASSGAVSPVWLPIVTPAGRLLRKLVRRIGIAGLAKIDYSDRRFFSNDPTPDEVKVPGSEPDLRQFVLEEQELHHAAFSRQFKSDLSILRKERIGFEGVIPDSHDLKFLLSEARTEQEIGLHLEVFGPGGIRIDRAFVTTHPGVTRESPHTLATRYEKSGQSRWAPLSVSSQGIVDTNFIRWADYQMSPASVTNAPWLRPDTKTVDTSKLPKALRQPDSIDPLNFVIPEGLAPIAEERPDELLVARVPDNIWEYALACTRNGQIDATTFRRFLFGAVGCERVIVGKDRVIRPRDPILADCVFAKRSVLGAAIRQFVQDATISIKARSKLYYRLGPGCNSPILTFFLGPVLGGLAAFGNTVRGTDPLVFRLLGSLSEEDWEDLARSGSLKLSETSADRKVMDKIVLCEAMEVLGAKGLPALYSHAQELCPDGVDASIDGSIRLSSQPGAAFESKSGDLIPTTPANEAVMIVNAFKFLRAAAARHGEKIANSELFRKILSGDARTWHSETTNSLTLTLRLPGGLRMESKLYDLTDLERTPVKAAQLPEAYRSGLYGLVMSALTQSSGAPRHAESVNGTPPVP